MSKSNLEFSNLIKVRQQKLTALLSPNQAILLAKPTDITYFSGFNQFLLPNEREAILLISQNQATLLHPHFTMPNIKLSTIEYQLGCHGRFLTEHLTKYCQKFQINQLLIEPSAVYVDEYFNIEKISELNISLFDRQKIVEMRMIKDELELNQIKKAVAITNKTLKATLVKLRIGMSERDVHELLKETASSFGGNGEAFPGIVAFGRHSALPHHQPSRKKLKGNMPVLIDFGVKYGGYCADMSRTIWFGDQPNPKFLQIERVVKTAYRKSLELVRQIGKRENLKQNTQAEIRNTKKNEPITCARVDQLARQIITTAGFGRYFSHTTGHGLGLDIHEPPSLNSQNPTPLHSSLVITIEPGIYLPNHFGYRHENTITV